jgi:DUF4097 and DUF4098 domain-containing protein YvlB
MNHEEATQMPTFDTPEPITATIDMGSGHLLIRASDRTDTVVDVRPSNKSDDDDVQAAERTEVDYAKGHLTVKAPKRKLRVVFGRVPSIDVVIDLPSGSHVDAKAWTGVRAEGRLGESSFDTAAGAIELDQTGRLKARTAAGNVSVTEAVGHADVSSSSGRVRIGRVDGTAVVKTSNGDITIGEVTSDVRLNTAYGDIEVDRALATILAKTAFGSVRIGEVVRGSVTLESGFGELELGIRNGTAAWLDVGSGHGIVRSDLDATTQPGASEETAEVRAHTGFGDVVIRRSAPAA